MFDFSHVFFRPMWRRVVIVSVCAAWGVFEIVTGSPFWAVIFFGFAGLSFWKLFLDQDNMKILSETDEN